MMRTETSELFNKDHRILVAVDNSDNAERAILYVSDILGGVSGFHVTILTVIPEPPADYFETETERNSWLEEQKSEATRMLDRYRQILIQSGFGFRKVHKQVCKRVYRHMTELGFSDFTGYEVYLDDHPEELQILDSMLQVTISRFYRDRGG